MARKKRINPGRAKVKRAKRSSKPSMVVYKTQKTTIVRRRAIH